ncbi:uncharacterized protein PV07_08765 [Cladophialophora immunda]|uniref:Uncharacterized protein n=1 Tax=Cladophialophora immunda TaxID=569365 RepID=A0A0D2CPV1_9EURO|nr:uncharacterized protein PV07_08765 [Cladophialophora immunda]KIW25599.1 hypothetical protein PV07_08765 [Cladophialophora immunda]
MDLVDLAFVVATWRRVFEITILYSLMPTSNAGISSSDRERCGQYLQALRGTIESSQRKSMMLYWSTEKKMVGIQATGNPAQPPEDQF